jgi:hypothetical protein
VIVCLGEGWYLVSLCFALVGWFCFLVLYLLRYCSWLFQDLVVVSLCNGATVLTL